MFASNGNIQEGIAAGGRKQCGPQGPGSKPGRATGTRRPPAGHTVWDWTRVTEHMALAPLELAALQPVVGGRTASSTARVTPAGDGAPRAPRAGCQKGTHTQEHTLRDVPASRRRGQWLPEERARAQACARRESRQSLGAGPAHSAHGEAFGGGPPEGPKWSGLRQLGADASPSQHGVVEAEGGWFRRYGGRKTSRTPGK